MKVSIRTAGKTAKRLYDRIKREKDISILSFCDNDAEKWTNAMNGIPVESAFETYKKYKEGIIEKIIVGTEMPVKQCRSIYRELIEVGFEKKDIYFVSIDYLKSDCASLEFMTYDNFNYLQYIEFHLTNKCNLNCAGCSHFIPLISDTEDIDFEKLKEDLKQLKTVITHISEIRIMGGEPFLSPYLEECCSLVRKLYPYARIKIVSNGILVKKMSKELILCIKRERIELDITCYPPFYDSYDSVSNFLKYNNIKFSMDIRWGMCPVLHKDEEHKFKHDYTALTCECYNLYKGYLYPCPLSAYIYYFNHYYDQNFPENEGINIYTENKFEDIYENLISNKKICDFCDHYGMTRNYKRNKFRINSKEPKMEDWIRIYEN